MSTVPVMGEKRVCALLGGSGLRPSLPQRHAPIAALLRQAAVPRDGTVSVRMPETPELLEA